MSTGIVMTGHCEECSFREHYVIHGVSWCPLTPATTRVDTNMLYGDEIWARRFTRPVAVGELVWVVDLGDGPDRPFASWARVEREHNDGFYLRIVGVTDGNGWCYSEPPAAPGGTQEAKK